MRPGAPGPAGPAERAPSAGPIGPDERAPLAGPTGLAERALPAGPTGLAERALPAGPTGLAERALPARLRPTARAWAELLRVSALFTVPGDALAGAASTGARAGRGTFLALGSSLCLYEAGMALNDWADHEEDAIDRPHRPIPSGRIAPAAALTASAALTAAGLVLAAKAGRAPLAVATTLAATVWGYDLHLKHTPAGPAAMATARALDLLLGATATATASAPARGLRSSFLPAALMGAHTYAVTSVSRHETQGGSTLAPLAALGTAAAVAWTASMPSSPPPHATPPHATPPRSPARLLTAALAATYASTAAKPLLHAALNPSPVLTQRAVGGGIRAMIPLQATLAAGRGAPGSGLAVMGLVPLARALARKVSPT